ARPVPTCAISVLGDRYGVLVMPYGSQCPALNGTRDRGMVVFTTSTRVDVRTTQTGVPRSSDQNDADVHHVGLSQTGPDKTSHGVKERVGIMTLEKLPQVEAAFRGISESGTVGHGARGVGWAVFAIGPTAQDDHTPHRIGAEVCRHGERELLVATSLA